MTGRYDAAGNVQAQFEPGSDGGVLANKLGVADAEEMADIELDLLNRLHEDTLGSVAADQRITVADVCEWHRRWLGNVSFREGNGRLSRLLASVMALQAGWPLPDYALWDNCRNDYFAAVQAGMSDYGPMKDLVRRALRAAARSADA